MEDIKWWTTDFMQTSGGMHMFEFRLCEREPDERLDHREKRIHPLTGKEEPGGHWGIGDGPKGEITYYPREMYEPLLAVKQRVILCLQGKGAENFAPSSVIPEFGA